MPGAVTVGDSDLCCCVPCRSSAIISLCWFYTGALGVILFQITTIILFIVRPTCKNNVCTCVLIWWASFEILGLCPVLNENYFCRMPVHTCFARCAWNGRHTCHWGHLFFFWGCTFVEFIYRVFTRMPGGVTVGDSDLCCCVPCLSTAIISICLLIFHVSINKQTKITISVPSSLEAL